MKRALWCISGGLLLYCLSYSGVLHGALAPPRGYEPAWIERTLDAGAYLSWFADSANHWLLPNRHLPFITEPVLFEAMALTIGKTAHYSGIPALAIYHLLQIALYIAGIYAWLFCARTFLPKPNHRLAAALVSLVSLPIWLYVPGPLHMLGVLDYAYQSADGLLRGGFSNGPNLTFGTLSLLLAFGFLGRYVQSQRRADLAGLCVCAFSSALVHPFEFFVFLPAALASLILLRLPWIRPGGLLVGAAFLGLSPHLWAMRFQWIRDASVANHASASPFWPIEWYGFPSLALVCLILLRARMREPTDLVLQAWLLCACLLTLVPMIPARFHIFDGFVYGQGFLLVRRVSQDPLLPELFRKRRGQVLAFASCMVVCSLGLLGSVWWQVYVDGNAPVPLYLNALESTDEKAAVAWLKRNARANSLILAPLNMAPLIAGAGFNAFASHDVLSVRYTEQAATLDEIYSAHLSKSELRRFLDRFGFDYAIFSSDVPIRLDTHFVAVGNLRVYAIPSGGMRYYPKGGLLSAAVTLFPSR